MQLKEREEDPRSEVVVVSNCKMFKENWVVKIFSVFGERNSYINQFVNLGHIIYCFGSMRWIQVFMIPMMMLARE